MSYPTTHTPPLGASQGRDLQSVQYDPEIGDYVVVGEKEIPHKSMLLALEDNPAFDDLFLLGSEVRNERNTNKARLITRGYPKRVVGGGAPNAVIFPRVKKTVLDRSELLEFVDKAEELSQLLEKGVAFPTDDFTRDIKIELGQGTENTERITTLRNAETAFKTRVYGDHDPETGWPIKVTRSVVFAIPDPGQKVPFGKRITYQQVHAGIWIKEERDWEDLPGGPFFVKEWLETDAETGFYTRYYAEIVTSLPSSPESEDTGLRVTYTPLADGKWLKVRVIALDENGDPIGGGSSVPFYSYTLDTTIDFTHPGYVDWDGNPPYELELMDFGTMKKTVAILDLDVRTGFTKRTKAEIDVEYFKEKPNRVTIVEWRPVDWIFQGEIFKIDIRNVLTNARLFSGDPEPTDSYFPTGYNESFNAPSSKPSTPGMTHYLSRSEYVAMIGTYQPVDSRVERLSNGTWRRTTIKAHLE